MFLGHSCRQGSQLQGGSCRAEGPWHCSACAVSVRHPSPLAMHSRLEALMGSITTHSASLPSSVFSKQWAKPWGSSMGNMTIRDVRNRGRAGGHGACKACRKAGTDHLQRATLPCRQESKCFDTHHAAVGVCTQAVCIRHCMHAAASALDTFAAELVLRQDFARCRLPTNAFAAAKPCCIRPGQGDQAASGMGTHRPDGCPDTAVHSCLHHVYWPNAATSRPVKSVSCAETVCALRAGWANRAAKRIASM